MFRDDFKEQHEHMNKLLVEFQQHQDEMKKQDTALEHTLTKMLDEKLDKLISRQEEPRGSS